MARRPTLFGLLASVLHQVFFLLVLLLLRFSYSRVKVNPITLMGSLSTNTPEHMATHVNALVTVVLVFTVGATVSTTCPPLLALPVGLEH